jgi:hypothetical protein
MISADNKLAIIYSASDAEYTVDISKFSSQPNSATWYNPRENTYQNFKIQFKKNSIKQKFNPPGNRGAGNDWVLILKA